MNAFRQYLAGISRLEINLATQILNASICFITNRQVGLAEQMRLACTFHKSAYRRA